MPKKRAKQPTKSKKKVGVGRRRTVFGDPNKKPETPPERATYREQYTCCRREGCPTCGGTKYKHGPYTYAFASKPGGGVWTWYIKS